MRHRQGRQRGGGQGEVGAGCGDTRSTHAGHLGAAGKPHELLKRLDVSTDNACVRINTQQADAHMRAVGNARFMGHLCCADVLPENIVHR